MPVALRCTGRIPRLIWWTLFTFILGFAFDSALQAEQRPTQIHDRIAGNTQTSNRVALTLDACSGGYDAELIDFLIRTRIPATIFATRKWLDGNPFGLTTLREHLDLFDIEDHGENHIPAVIGAGRRVYGLRGESDIVHLRAEVLGGARAVEAATGVPPHWYRGATAEYDQAAADEIRRLGYGIAGFSVNADQGATLGRDAVIARMNAVRPGDVILAHMNRPRSQTAEGLRPGLLALLRRGLVFVRLDQIDLVPVP